MSSYDPELKAKGDDGENRFRAWLDACGRSYVHVNQSPEMFAQLFKPGKVKRPDFLVLIDSIGLRRRREESADEGRPLHASDPFGAEADARV
jgi:hypothetical protein